MFRSSDQEPDVRVRRQSSLPSHQKAPELSMLQARSQQGSSCLQSEEEEENSPSHSQEGDQEALWLVKDQWTISEDDLGRENQKLRAEQEELLTSMEGLKLENETLRLQRKRSELRMEQLHCKSVFETDQLRKQIKQLGAAIQKTSSPPPSKQPIWINSSSRQHDQEVMCIRLPHHPMTTLHARNTTSVTLHASTTMQVIETIYLSTTM